MGWSPYDSAYVEAVRSHRSERAQRLAVNVSSVVHIHSSFAPTGGALYFAPGENR
jgi:hypothetical protein